MSVAEEREAYPVLRKDQDGVARLTLNRPKAYNALSLGLMAALQDELQEIATNRSIKAVVIEGAGRGFAPGTISARCAPEQTKPFTRRYSPLARS